MEPVLVLVEGLPGSGKTTIAKKLAKDLDLPLITKDDIKEILFDTLGWGDLAWSKKLGGATYEILFRLIQVHMKAGKPLMIESTFRSADATPVLEKLRQEVKFHIVEVLCFADGEELVRRFKQRSDSGKRHPGHVDSLNTDLLQDLLAGKAEPVGIDPAPIEVDTTDWSAFDYDAILKAVRSRLPEQ